MEFSLQKKATVIASTVATFLVVIKLIIGLVSGSVAVLASAVDSILDIFVSIFNYFAIHSAEKPPNEKFNYGLGKIEALAAVIEGLIISASGLFIAYEGIIKIIHKEPVTNLGISLVVMVISILITTGLVLFLESVAKKTGNLVIKSEALHYKTDLFTNSAVLLSLLIVHFTKFYAIDGIFGLLIAFYIIYSASKLIKEGILILMDVSLEDEIIEKIIEIIKTTPKVTDYHFLKTRKAGPFNFVDVHLVFSRDISLEEAHHISDLVEEKIRSIDPDKRWEITIHLDPFDDSDKHTRVEASQPN
ncbi:cation diffusion facilitator family transporter [Thermodesulfatator indicus DSM 15286]|uniref:Cation diffusion facilitator family transporter n=1 Tax=Thermodesulfatator indicus (strain DSM 15286 / JCM 11887 / CIR29812) TaxID=667014 RepID=F8ABY9_THEID|nr:cation diffusion facilitator family transporter [Thermodesulfatator indicus]AEH45681.1 cation diffusion facilitator family transporter [Thermodesulfatator indicus DSM 15286]